jgi:colanic acid/amylovoran biosynthesis glycosyltransferase
MIEKPIVKVGLVVNDFLPVGNVWIWRQLFLKNHKPEIIFAKIRSNEELYPASNVVICKKSSILMLKIRMKLWILFKHFYYGLSRKAKQTITEVSKKHSLTVLHAHFGTVGCEVLNVCKELKLPLLVTFHGFDATSVPNRWPGYTNKLHELFRYAHKTIAVSHFIRERLIALGCPAEKIAMSYLGVPIPEACKPYSKQPARTRFIHIGSFVEKKGVPDLVRAFTKAFPVSSNVELLLVGKGPDKALCQNLISELKPANPILMKDAVPSNLVYKEFLDADVFVLNSRIDSQGTTEGLPIALLEAQSYGLPAISTLHAGIPEAIIHNETGLLIREKDEEALINALQQMNNAGRIKQMGTAAYEFMKRKFDLELCNNQLDELYRQAGSGQL